MVRYILAFTLALLTGISSIVAQDGIHNIVSFNPSKTNVPMFDLFAGGTFSYQSFDDITTSNSYFLPSDEKLIGIPLEFYIQANLYLTNKRSELCLSTGFMHDKLSFKDDIGTRNGFVSQWFTVEVGYKFSLIRTGFKNRFLINANAHNDNHFTYVGLNEACLNRYALAWYIGLSPCLTNIDIEGRMGIHIITPLNPSLLAYNNMHRNTISRLFFEVKIGFRLFSTGNRTYNHMTKDK